MAEKLIGLIGGMSWESSALYYRLLNTMIHERLGGHHNARSVLLTLDYDELDRLAGEGNWQQVGEIVANAAERLQGAGADFVMITAVTGHVVAPQVESRLSVPLLHIADPVGAAVRNAGHSRVGLVGTRFTMEMDFLTRRLKDNCGLDVMVPSTGDRKRLQEIISMELTLGLVREESKAALLKIAGALREQGAEAIIVGCTELPLLAPMTDYPLPAFDVVRLHAGAAVALAVG